MNITDEPTFAGDFLHICPFANAAIIDEHDPEIVHCKCFESPDFLDAQDKRAVALDAQRVVTGQG